MKNIVPFQMNVILSVCEIISEYLEYKDILSMLLVCKNMKIRHIRILYGREYDLPEAPSLKYLTSLDMGKNYNATIPKHLNLTNLVRLDITGCNWKYIDHKLENLKWLKCKSNEFITNFNGINRLTYLDCSSCAKLPLEVISQLYNLKTLICYSNKWITSLDTLVSVTHLDIAGCKNILPESIRSMVNLTYLDCSFISRITDLNSLVNLKFLKCSNCPSLSMKGIYSLTNLFYLDVINNQWVTNLALFKQLTRLDCWFCTKLSLRSTKHIKTVNYAYISYDWD